MEAPGSASRAALEASLRDAGQEHLVAHAAQLPVDQAQTFLEGAAAWPWARLRAAVLGPRPTVSPSLRPPQALRWRRQMAEGGLRLRLAKQGLGLLAGGRVATLLLAGGQGTRLGHPGPKGTFPLAGDASRPLYKVLAERIVAMGRVVGAPIPWIVLTSPQTDAATRAAFAEAGAWGLAPEQLEFVVQGELPVLDASGQALLTEPGSLALAPDGHGGALTALAREGVLERLRARGVQVLTTFQVDNPLARPLDPVMLGWMVEQSAQVVSKAVAKATPEERVGVFARDLAGRHRIVEYTELPEEGAEDLTLGSIALHALSARWLDELLRGGFELPLHTAHKRVPFLDASGTQVDPEAPNAIKLEQFFFDCFPEAERFSVHEVKREWEFAPIKNAAGTDSPLTAQLLVDAEVRRWHQARGLTLPDTPALRPLEIDGGEAWDWPARIERG